MAQDRGLVWRGLLLLGFLSALALLVVLMMLRRDTAPPAKEQQADLVALGVPNPAAGFPANINWMALGKTSESLPSSTAWEVRNNATIALARHGSAKLPMHRFVEMLDEPLQMRNFRVKLPDGKDMADEAAARRAIHNALEALVEWHKFKPAVATVAAEQTDTLRSVYAAVERLTHSDNAKLREEAVKAKKSLGI
jgi:hypothetical protein